MAGTFIRDKSGRILSYSSKEAPSQERLKKILSTARQQRAKSVGLVVSVKHFQGYEMKEGDSRIVRAFRGKALSPEQFRNRITGPDSLHATDFLLRQTKLATGAEEVSGLKSFTLNFIH